MIKEYNLQNIEPIFKQFLISENISKITIKNYLSDIRGYFFWYEKNKVSENHRGCELFSKESVTNYIGYLQESKKENRAINRVLSSLRRLFCFCQKEGLISENTLADFSNLKEGDKVDINQDEDINKSKVGKDYDKKLNNKNVNQDKKQKTLFDRYCDYLNLNQYSQQIDVETLSHDVKDYISYIYVNVNNKPNINDIANEFSLTIYFDDLKFAKVKQEIYDRKKTSLNHFFTWMSENSFITAQKLSYLNSRLFEGSNKKNNDNKNKQTKNKIFKNIKVKKIKKSDTFIYALIVFLSLLIPLGGIWIYSDKNKEKGSEVLSENKKRSDGRVIDFKGRLKDENGNVVNSKIDLTFRLYDSKHGVEYSYIGKCHGTEGINPDYNGNFSVKIGEDCSMEKIPEEIFHKDALFLGITIRDKAEMKPRYALPTTAYAKNTDKVKGLSIGTDSKSIPYINEEGDIILASESPMIKSNSGNFSLEGQTLLFKTEEGSKGSIFINPDVGGNTHIGSGSLAVGTNDPKALFDVGGDSAFGGNITFYSSNSIIKSSKGNNLRLGDLDTGKIVIKPKDNISIGTVYTVDKITLGGNVSPSKNGVYNLGRQDHKWNDIYAKEFHGEKYETDGADFAEYFEVDENVQEGDIVALTESGIVKALNNGILLGVVSGDAGFIGNAKNKTENSELIGLIGQIDTNISTVNGEIKKGDPISFSDVSGYGSLLKKNGQVLGFALESTVGNENFEKNNCPLEEIDEDVRCGMLKVLVRVNWFNQEDKEKIEKVVNNIESKKNNPLASAQINTGKVFEASKKVEEFLFKNIEAVTGNFESISSKKIVSPVIESENLKTKEINSEYVTAEEMLADMMKVRHASVSGNLTAKNVQSENIEKIEENLDELNEYLEEFSEYNDSINYDINDMKNKINDIKKIDQEALETDLTDVKNLIESYNIKDTESYNIDDKELLLENINITGNANLYSASVSDGFTAGNVYIKDEDILSLSWDLNLSSLSEVTFFDDDVVISKDGNMEVKGELTVDKLTVNNKDNPDNSSIIDGNGNAQFNKISLRRKFTSSESAAMITPRENLRINGIKSFAIESHSDMAGRAIIPAGEDEIVIYNDGLNENSLVYLTATSVSNSTKNIILGLSDLRPCSKNSSSCRAYFRVRASESTDSDISFNWLVIN